MSQDQTTIADDLSADWHSAARCGEDVDPPCPGCVIGNLIVGRDALRAERDAALGVVEAARALRQVWGLDTNDAGLGPRSRALIVAVDAWESRAESADG